MFKINTQQARAYDQRGGYINEAGKYTGTIKAAVWHIGESPKGRSENVKLGISNKKGAKNPRKPYSARL